LNEPHYVVYVNGPELLTKALASLRPIWDDVVIVDNRDAFTTQPHPIDAVPPDLFQAVKFYKPQFPMNQAQLLTWLTIRCHRDGFEWFTWSHHDSVSVGNTIEDLRATAIGCTDAGRNWGMIFTRDPGKPEHGPWNHVDTMCAVNVKALLAIGGWDWYRFPDYYSDYDAYGKLRAAGFEMIQSGLPIDHLQGGSQTVAADGNRALVKLLKMPVYAALWEARRLELGLEWPPA
jgi:hypothetical protein